MTVGELVALLSACDPRDTVICDARSDALLVIGARAGMHQECDEPAQLTAADEDFLSTLHIRPGR